MKRAHTAHSERSRTAGRYPSPATRPALSRLAPGGRRGFTIIELAVSLGIFLLLATVLTITVARSLGASTTARIERASEAAMSSQLAKLSSVPYDQLVSGNFTVPDPCPGAPAGIRGESCVKTGAVSIRVGYQFQDLAATASGVDCAASSTPRRTSDSFGYVGLCANVVSAGGANLALNSLELHAATKVPAPSPAYRADAGVVRAKLTGNLDTVKGGSLFLVKTANPAAVVASSVISTDTVFLSVPAAATTPVSDTCTDASPCMLALNPGPQPTVSGDNGLFASTATGPSAAVTVTAGSITETTAEVLPTSSVRLNLKATNGSLTASNNVPGSVCLWATFVDAGVKRTVPACNTSNPARIDLDFYDPSWDQASAGAATYPYPPGVPVTVSVDHPDGLCYRAPGMVGSVPGAPASGAVPAGWGQRAVCTSFTWGVPTGLDKPVTLGTDGKQTALDVVWAADPAGAALPAAGVPGAGEVWAKPRQATGCATDATCRTVVDVPMEKLECDSATPHCFSGENRDPSVSTPATRLLKNDSTGLSAAYKIVIDDPENDTVTVKAAARSLGSGTLTWSTSATGTFAAFPASGATLGTPSSGTATVWVKFDRPAGDTALRTFDLQLSDGVGTGSRTETIGLYYADAPWVVTGGEAQLTQGGSTTLTATVTSTSGTPAAGEQVTFSSAAGLVFAPSAVATTDASGVATVTVSGTAVPAGTATVTATTSNGRTGTFTLRVKAAPGSLTVAGTGATQGGTGSVTVTARDRAGAPLAGVVVTMAASAGTSTTPSDVVYPKQSGCVTTGAGTCTVPLIVSGNAPAGSYTVRAASGSFTSSTTVTVTASPGSLATTPDDGAVAAQGDMDAPLELVLLDKAGKPMSGASVTLTGITGVSLSPTTVTSGAGGKVSATVAVSPTKPAGKYTLTGKSGSVTMPFTVVVKVSANSLSFSPVSIAQGSTAVLDVTALDTAGSPAPGMLVSFSTDTDGITVESRAVTGADGTARVNLSAAGSVPAAEYTVTATLDGIPYPVPVRVSATPATISVSGAVAQGEINQDFRATVRDLAGDPIPNQNIAVAWNTPTLKAAPTSGTTTNLGYFDFTTSDTGPTKAGTYQLTLTAGALTTNVPVTVAGMPASVSAAPSSVQLTTHSTQTITVTVVDRAGDPLPGQVISASVPVTEVPTSTSGPTDAAGRTTVTFTGGASVVGRQEQASIATADGTASATVAFSVLPPATHAHLTAGPTALWPMDTTPGGDTGVVNGSTYDTSFSRPGVLTDPGDPTGTGYAPGSGSTNFSVTPASGAVAKATQVAVADPAATLVPATGSFTVTSWVKPRSLVYPRSGISLTKGNLTSVAKGPGFAIGEGSTSTTLQVELADGANASLGQVALPAGQRVTDWVGKWTQVTVVYDRAGGAALVYVNGVYAGSTSIAAVTGSVSSPAPLVIGNNSGWRFDGEVDDTAVYPGALSAGQVYALSNTRLDTYSGDVLATGPQSYYKLGESAGAAVDYGQAKLDLTATSNSVDSTWTRGAPGIVTGSDKAIWFGGSASAGRYLNVPTDARHQGQNFSVAMWLTPNDTDSTGYRAPVFARDDTQATGWNVYVAPVSNGSRPRSEWQFWSGKGPGNGFDVLYTNVSAQPGRTVHVVVTRTGGVTRFYLDGSLIAQKSTPVFAPMTTRGLQISGVSSVPWAGTVDDVAVYDRALSDVEVRKLSDDGR